MSSYGYSDDIKVLKDISISEKKYDYAKVKEPTTDSKASYDLSKINYWKAPPENEQDGECHFNTIPSSDTDNVSHALYDRLADKFYGISNFNADLHWTNVNIAGSWGSHAYEYSCWEDAERPLIKIRSYHDLQLTEEEQNGVLTDRIIGTCSSYLDRSPETEEYAMCKCILSEKREMYEFHKLLHKFFDIHRCPMSNFNFDIRVVRSASQIFRAMFLAQHSLWNCIILVHHEETSEKLMVNQNLNDISALKYFHYLQYLDLSKNQITTLEALGELPFLMYLDASSNLLTEVLDFKAPFNLMFANYSYNDIKTIKDLSDFWSLTVLDLSHNEIEGISGLQNLRHLRGLNLSHNWIAKLEGLNHLERIQCLNLYNNIIDRFETGPDVGFKTMTRLKKLSLAKNLLKSLQIIEQARFLEVLDISDNRIEDILQLIYLKDLNRLNDLDMRENPVRYNPRYFDTCVSYTKNIFLLDGDEVTAEAKVLCRKKFEKTIYEYVKTRNQHLLLNYVNFPYIARTVIPYTDPPRPMIVLVGPPSCLKGLLVDVFCEIYPQYVSRGVSHTTRPRSEGEIDGEQYRFITYDTFKEMMRKGLFFITSEYFGHLYGFAQSELVENSPRRTVIILHSDLNGALLLRARGLRPTLVLTIPKSEEMHRRYLRRKYICHSLQSGILEIGITFNKTYEGLMRMKNYTHRNVIIAVKDMLTEVFKNAWDDKSLGTIHNPDLSIYGGLTIQNLLQGNEGLVEPRSDLNALGNSQEAEWRYMKLLQSKEQKIFCLKSKDEVQYNYLKSIGVDRIIKEHLLADEDSIENISNEQSVPEEGTKQNDEEPEVTEVPHLQRLFDEVIANRKTYLELHWANPGLFSQVLFTDQLDHGLDVLTEVLKICVQTYHLRSPACEMKYHPKNHPLVQKRLEHLHSLMSTDGMLANEKNNCYQQQLGFQNVEGKSYLNDMKNK